MRKQKFEDITREELYSDLRSKGKVKTKAEFDFWLRRNVPKESYYQTAILRYLKSKGFFAWKATAGIYARGGIPDIIAVKDGQFYAFEVKRPLVNGDNPEAEELQKSTIRKLKAHGAVCGVVVFVKDVERMIGK